MRQNRLIAAIIILISVFVNCSQNFLDPQPAIDSRSIFINVWNDFDKNYVFFDLKKDLNWDSVYQLYAYGTQIPDNLDPISPSYGCFWNDILFPFHDWKVNLWRDINPNFIATSYPEAFHYTITEPKRTFMWDYDLLSQTYLNNLELIYYDNILDGTINDSIFYLFISLSGMSNCGNDVYDELFNKINKYNKLIFDLRDENGDINHTVIDKIVSHFTDTPILYCYSQTRATAGRIDFTTPEPHYIQPASANTYKGKLIVLIDHYTGDAGELMANAFKQVSATKTVGIKTSGIVSSASIRELPDGSYYTTPTIRYLDANKKVLEGKGIVPDIIVSADTDTIWNAHDEILDSAIAILKK